MRNLVWLRVSDADNIVAGWSQMHLRDTGPLTKIVRVLAKTMKIKGHGRENLVRRRIEGVR